jgi:hypothetical protein
MVKGIHLVCMGIFDVNNVLGRVYPLVNEGMGLISVMCHNKKIVFEKYRS